MTRCCSSARSTRDAASKTPGNLPLPATADDADPDAAAWLVAAITAGIGMKESTGLPLPEGDRLHDALLAVIRGLTNYIE
jgi:hypothetical protein